MILYFTSLFNPFKIEHPNSLKCIILNPFFIMLMGSVVHLKFDDIFNSHIGNKMVKLN